MGAARQPFLNRPFNVSGSPAPSVCNGFTATGLPIGFQIGGWPFEDALALRVGDAVERAMGTRSHRPALGAFNPGLLQPLRQSRVS